MLNTPNKIKGVTPKTNILFLCRAKKYMKTQNKLVHNTDIKKENAVKSKSIPLYHLLLSAL